jgi:hypothetical protein
MEEAFVNAADISQRVSSFRHRKRLDVTGEAGQDNCGVHGDKGIETLCQNVQGGSESYTRGTLEEKQTGVM